MYMYFTTSVSCSATWLLFYYDFIKCTHYTRTVFVHQKGDLSPYIRNNCKSVLLSNKHFFILYNNIIYIIKIMWNHRLFLRFQHLHWKGSFLLFILLISAEFLLYHIKFYLKHFIWVFSSQMYQDIVYSEAWDRFNSCGGDGRVISNAWTNILKPH